MWYAKRKDITEVIIINLLIIYAHPNPNSYNFTILEKFKGGICDEHHVRVLDLYQEEFNPVLYFDDTNKRRDLQCDPTTKEYREQLIWADHVVFIFPIWWSGMPAILKGYIDRVFAKGFAYEYKGIFPIGLLPKKTATIITTHDTPSIYVKLFQKDYGKILQKQILKMCGIKTTRTLTLSFLRHSNESQRTHFLKKVFDCATNI